jgi:hypothetical protein
VPLEDVDGPTTMARSAIQALPDLHMSRSRR